MGASRFFVNLLTWDKIEAICFEESGDGTQCIRRDWFSSEKAAALKLKADLHIKVVKAASRCSHRELQNILQTSQPRISDLLRGEMSKFSLEMLVGYAERLGLKTSIKTQARTRSASAGKRGKCGALVPCPTKSQTKAVLEKQCLELRMEW